MATTARLEENGFAKLRLEAGDAALLLKMMKARIRRISHLEQATPADFAEVSRLARLCYVVSSFETGMSGSIPHLSREDIDSIYVLPVQDSEGLLAALNEVRTASRSGGPVDPVMADWMVKSLVEVMVD